MKEELKQLALAATQGEWIKIRNQPCYKEIVITTKSRKGKYIPICEMDSDFSSVIGKEQKANAAYIAKACPANILALIESHEAVRQQHDELLKIINKSRAMFVGIRNYSTNVDIKACRVAVVTCESMIVEIDQAIAKHKGDV